MKKVKTIIVIILLILLLPIIIVNSVIIVNSYMNPDKIPSFCGWKPFIVLSGSMETQIKTGDLVIVKETDNEKLKEGDIIAFRNNAVVVTHRIVEKIEDEGKIPGKFKKVEMNIKVDKTAIKKHFKETGEIVPGIKIVDGKTSLRIK